MNKKFKFLTVLLALVMTIGAFAPFSARAEEAKETTETVTLHKILMDEDAFSKFTAGTTGKDGKEYDGNEITDIKGFFADTKAEEIGGVYFVLKVKDGDYVKHEELTPEEIALKETNPAEYKKILDKKKLIPSFEKDQTTNEPTEVYKTTTNIEEAVGGLTTEAGVVFTTAGLKGEFVIDEVHELSTYKGTTTITDKNGKTTEVNTQLTDMKAVPVNITLPLVNNEGVVVNAHVYPKNIEDRPEIDKNFVKDHGLTEVIKDGKSNETINAGADYKNYQKEKAKVTAEIGKVIPYEVKTKLPKDAKYKTAIWNDSMTNGLTFNKDLKISGLDGFVEGNDYILEQDDRGFKLTLTEAGLKKLEKELENSSKEVILVYSATVNSDCVVDQPEKNHIEFEYNNQPTEPTPEPPETTPNNKEISVTKKWSEETAPTGVVVVYTLQEKDGDNWKNVKSVTITGPDYNYTFTELDDAKTYRVQERVSGYTPEYKAEKGKYSVTNKKNEGPKPLEPTTPEVVNGGKKFVKTNQDSERLAGAEFVVKDSTGKYLALKSDKTVAAEVTAYETAEANYNKFIKAYNEIVAKAKADKKDVTYPISIDGASYANKDAVDAKLNELKNTRDTKFLASRENYQWITAKDGEAAKEAGALVLTSDNQGRFEVTGLAYGTYTLEEVKAPEGYAKLSGDVEFVVKKGSYNGQPEGVNHKHIGYDSDTDTIKGQQIENKKVSIPQTGGIGTVIFTVVGVMLMVGAAFALKRRKEDELEGLA